MATLILVLYILSTSTGLILLKYGAKSGLPISFIGGKISLNFNTFVIIGLFLYVVSFLLYIYLISKNDLGYIIPLASAFVYVAIFTGSYFVFHETFNAFKIVGIGLIISGIVMLSLRG